VYTSGKPILPDGQVEAATAISVAALMDVLEDEAAREKTLPMYMDITTGRHITLSLLDNPATLPLTLGVLTLGYYI